MIGRSQQRKLVSLANMDCFSFQFSQECNILSSIPYFLCVVVKHEVQHDVGDSMDL